MNKPSCLGLLATGLAVVFSMASYVQRPKMRAIDIITQMQVVAAKSGELINRLDTSTLIYYGDLVIYREKYQYIKFNQNAIQNDTMVVSNDPKTIDYKETRYDYYVWREGSNNGLKYNGDNKTGLTINVDSVYIKKLFKNAEFYNIKYDRLASIRNDGDKKSFLETYVNVTKPDDSYCDTTLYRFSSKYSDIPYSLSKTADNLKQSKLVEVRFIYNSVPKGISETIDLPRREMIYKISKIEMKMSGNLDSLLKKFNADSKKLIQ